MVEYFRKTSEALILVIVAASPWAFGGVHPISRYFISAGLGAVLALWAIELVISPKNIFTRYQIPILMLTGLIVLQLLPLGGIASLISPAGAALKAEMMPAEMEVFADGSLAEIPFWTARGRVSIYPAQRRYVDSVLVHGLMGLSAHAECRIWPPSKRLRRLCFVCLDQREHSVVLCCLSAFHVRTWQQIYWHVPLTWVPHSGRFVNRNHFAFYINICFGLSLGLVGSRLMGRFKSLRPDDLVDGLKDSLSLWMISVLLFMLGAVILCSSRGGMISLVGGTLITAVFIAATGSFQRSWKWFLLAAGIFAGAAAIQIWLGFDFINSRYAMHDDDRTAVWFPLMSLIPKFPLTGTGMGTLAYLEPFTRNSAAQKDTFLENAHNEYLQLTLELGIPGLLCGLSLLGMLILKIARRVRSSRHNAWLYVGALFGLCTVTLHSFVEFFGYSIPATGLLVAVLFGHIAGVGRVRKSSRSTQEPSSQLWQTVSARAFAVVLLAFAFFAVRDAKRHDMADRYWRLGQRAQQAGNSDEELQNYFNAVSYSPNDAEHLMDSSRVQFLASREKVFQDQAALVLAQRDLIRARELCPLAAEVQFLIGQAASTFERADDELVYFERALKPRPADETLWYITGRTYLEQGELQAAAEHFQRSLEIHPGHLGEILTLAHESSMDRELIMNRVLALSKSLPLLGAVDWFVKRAGGESSSSELDELTATLRQRALQTPEFVNPNSGDLCYRKAELLELLDKTQEAASAYKLALSYEPQKTAWRLRLAAMLGEQKRYDEAHRQIERILQSQPNYAPAKNLAEALSRQKAAE